MKNLVIVESLAKAKTIEKFLNSSRVLQPLGSFKVVASFGHIDNLPSKELGIDISDDFTIKYQLLPDKKKLVDELKEKSKNVDVVWIASDADYEGEKIADSICKTLKLKSYKRITFTEITQKALETSLRNPRIIDRQMVDAQETRRILDRLVGYKISPLLWKTYKTANMSGLSAGRVQSAVMHIIIQREINIREFVSTPYWYLVGAFTFKSKGLKDINIDDVKMYKDGVVYKTEDHVEVKNILRKLRNKFHIQDITSKTSKQSPDAPYVTSSFQQDAYNKHGINLKRSMQIAQELYENGYITYMRTDSYALSSDFKESVKVFVDAVYGIEYWGDGKGKLKQSKNAQEAHEAIRPTNVETVNLVENGTFGKDHKKIYEMIWKRTVASLLKPSVYNELVMNIIDESMIAKKVYFVANMKKLIWNGYQIVYGVKNENNDIDEIKSSIKDITCNSIIAKNTWTHPPPRFNESSLVKVMESEGIGRPSTYSATIQKLIDKSYIVKSDITGETKQVMNYVYNLKQGTIVEQESQITIGEEKMKVIPTSIGKEIDEYVSKCFPYIVDNNFTSLLETDLDRIAHGEKRKIDVLTTFWGTFNHDLTQANEEMKSRSLSSSSKRTLTTESKNITCNGIMYTVRLAKYGPVIEYIDKNGGRQFIGLKHYLKYVKKEYLDINEDDVNFMVKLPIKLKDVNGNIVTCLIGPYGMYLKTTNNTNHKLPLFAIHNIIQSQGDLDAKVVTKIIEYKTSPDRMEKQGLRKQKYHKN